MFHQNLAFRTNTTVSMGFHFLWSHVPFEHISSSMSPPLHCDSAHSVLQILDVEVSSVAEIWPDVICGPADVPVWASVRSFLENWDFRWNQSWHLKYLLGGGMGLGDGTESWLSSQECTALVENPSSDPSICTGWFTMAWISNSRDSDTLIWPPQTTSLICAYTHTQLK